MSRPDQARLSPGAPQLSVVIPVYAPEPKSVESLAAALRDLKASSFQDFEIIVADDGSPAGDAVRAVVRQAGAELVRLDRRRGPAAARNAGASKAKSEILVFMDADTSAHSDTLDRFARKFRENPGLDAVVGSYDQTPTAPAMVSRFRNLLHSFVHHRAKHRASTFWAGCGAVRRARFQALGGFDESFRRPSIEDVEFGFHLRKIGGWIELDREIQVTHHKAWTLRSMVWTDFFVRAVPWAALLRRYPLPCDLNFKILDRISGALVAATLLAGIIALLHGGAWWLAPPISLALIGLLNWPMFRFLARAGSWREALLFFPLLLTYFATGVAGLLGGLALAEHRRDRFLWPSVAVIGVVLLAIQIAGGAFQAEFTGHPDESAHLVSGLMVYDYLVSLPRENPIAWAGQYYLHYPKVAIGHWPPGYYALEAVWWLFLGPSRWSAMLLQWAIGVAALTVLYRLARASFSLPITAGIIACTIATPVFQQSLDQTMADLCCLLWSVLIMLAVVRLVDRQDGTAAFLLVLWLLAAALTKGTVVCLLPVPVVALLASRQPIRIPLPWLVAAATVILAPAAWYLWMGGIRAWGGMSTSEPWPGASIGHLAGWGFLGLACLGLRRNPLALAAVSVIVCTLGVSFVVRAMREDRHWIIALPAILVLAGFGLSRFHSPLIVGALLVPALLLFPFSWYRQSESGYAGLVRQLRRPARMLISSSAMGEGPWTAVTSLAEKRPGSLVARASKVLAVVGADGEGYRLLYPTRNAVARRLDELAIDTVILHSPPTLTPRPHHALLQDAIGNSTAWRPCGIARDLLAYCRVNAPQFPRQPLRLHVYGWDFEERIRQ
jgi:glycosyltransferase involved in cell wall biosynthesis